MHLRSGNIRSRKRGRFDSVPHCVSSGSFGDVGGREIVGPHDSGSARGHKEVRKDEWQFLGPMCSEGMRPILWRMRNEIPSGTGAREGT